MEQASGIEQVNKAVTSMDTVTQQNAALVEQASAAAHTLTEQAASLTELISRYRLDKGPAVAPGLTASRPPAPKPAGVPDAAPAVERRKADRPFRGRKESTPRARQPEESKAAAGDDDVWQEF
jgi:hypothetical protein